MALAQPRIVDRGKLTIVGMSERYTPATLTEIPTQWFQFQSRVALATGRVDANAYGVWFDVLRGGGQFTYISGVAVGEFAPVHPQFSRALIPPLRYAVFQHQGAAQEIRSTMDAIVNQWLPQSGRAPAQIAGAPDFFEVYSEEFNRTGSGPIEIWLPIKQ